MAFQPVPNCAEINIIYTYNAVLVQNVFYGKFGGIYTLVNLEVLATAIDAAVGADWLAIQPSEAVYLRTEVRGLSSENDLLAIQDFNAGPGLLAQAALPNNVTLAIKKSSAYTGRSARGRSYWIGISDAHLDPANENMLTAVAAAARVDAVDQIRVAINGALLWTAVIVSRFTGGAKRAEGVTFPWVSTATVDLRVDTQRDRLPG